MNFKHHISRFLSISLLLAFLLITSDDMHATHIVGGNITYKYLSPNTYQIKLTLRRDCFLGSPEAEFDPWASIGIFAGNGDLATWISPSVQVDSFSYGQLFLPFVASDTLNEYIESDCGFEGTQVCVHQTTYQGIVRLPNARSDGYIFAYQRCCRNATLANIQDPLETGATYWVHLSGDAMKNFNNSPNFNQWPDVYICANEPLNFDHSATDSDGDSLVYRLSLPNDGAMRLDAVPTPASNPPYTNILWQSPYGMDNMLGGVPLKIDAKTGLITGTPNLVGQFLVGILVDEYRNGELIGTVRRDFQYNVRVCSQPPLAQFSTSESNCDGLTVEFYNESLSATKYEWNFNYPSIDPNFISTEKDPIFTYPSSGKYDVLLRVTRGSDGCFDTILQTVSVFTNTIKPEFNYQVVGCSGTDITLKLTDMSSFAEPGYNLTDFTWTVTQNGLSTQFNGKTISVPIALNGDLKVDLTVSADNGCTTSTSQEISLESLLPKIDFTYALAGCTEDNNATLRFSNTSAILNPYATIQQSEWNINGTTYIGDIIDVVLPNVGTVNVKLINHFEDDCDIDLTRSFDINEIIPHAAYIENPLECPDSENVKIKYTYQGTNALGLSPTDISWTLTTASGVLTGSGSEVDFTVPKDSLVTLRLHVTFANGCQDDIVKTYVPGPFATLKFIDDPIILCPGQSKSIITGGNANWTYTWSPTLGLDLTDPSNPIINTTENITYAVTVTDGLCDVTGSVDVIVLEGGVVLSIEGDDYTCDGSVQLSTSGGIGTGEYIWSTDPNNINIVGTGQTLNTTFTTPSQTYYVIFEGESCSTMPASITVTNQTPNFEHFAPAAVCNNDTFKIILNNLNPNHQNTYSWGANSHILSGGNTENPTIIVSDSEKDPFSLTYTVTNQFGCSKSETIVINIRENPIVDFVFDKPDCGKNEICFKIVGEYEEFIVWDFGDLSTTDDRSLEGAPCYLYPEAGTYTVSLTNIPGICPFVPISKEVEVSPSLLLSVTPDTISCMGNEIILQGVANADNLTYAWTDAQGNVLSINSSINVTVNGDATYYLDVKDSFGCEIQDSVHVSAFVFDYDLSSDAKLCFDNDNTISIQIDDPLQYNFTWTPNDKIISGQSTNIILVHPTDTLTYYVNIENKYFGCTTTAAIKPEVHQPIPFTLSAPEQFCFNQPVTLHLEIENPENYTYDWSPSELITNGDKTTDPTVLISENQLFTVTVTDNITGCTRTANVNADIASPTTVTINAEPDFTIFEGESLDLFVENPIENGEYTWSTGASGTTITVNNTDDAVYFVTVTDANGCTATDEVTVTVRKAKCDDSDVYIPNAFTPNGDDVNDKLFVRSNFIDEMLFVVYNRWGQEVFSTTNPDEGWDGTFQNRELEPDAFCILY
ncbi:MAG: gliding motility-associated C-terminal domain-containing protein [Saprospiraceae bacterium]